MTHPPREDWDNHWHQAERRDAHRRTMRTLRRAIALLGLGMVCYLAAGLYLAWIGAL